MPGPCCFDTCKLSKYTFIWDMIHRLLKGCFKTSNGQAFAGFGSLNIRIFCLSQFVYHWKWYKDYFRVKMSSCLKVEQNNKKMIRKLINMKWYTSMPFHQGAKKSKFGHQRSGLGGIKGGQQLSQWSVKTWDPCQSCKLLKTYNPYTLYLLKRKGNTLEEVALAIQSLTSAKTPKTKQLTLYF